MEVISNVSIRAKAQSIPSKLQIAFIVDKSFLFLYSNALGEKCPENQIREGRNLTNAADSHILKNS